MRSWEWLRGVKKDLWSKDRKWLREVKKDVVGGFY